MVQRFKGSRQRRTAKGIGMRYTSTLGGLSENIKANIDYRIIDIECRSNVCCLFYKKGLSRAIPHFDIRYSTFCNSAVRFSSGSAV